jgi:rhodanese-related sulfurtransferase
MIKEINVETLKAWLASNQAILIDVREPYEYAQQNIAEAILLPLSEVCVAALPDLQGKKLVIHCRSGMRSANACAALLAEDPELDVYNLAGGILAWS